MSLLADVHVKTAYCNALRSHNHDVIRVQDVISPDAVDATVMEYARDHNRVVLTNDDKDFKRFETHHEVLFVPQNMRPKDVETTVSRIERQFDTLEDTVQYLRDWL
jgi:predicted nuclease of predicted toxin-antitoxin system